MSHDHDDGIEPGRMTDPAAIREFVAAGNAIFTIVSIKTGTRFTYRVRSVNQEPGSTSPVGHFVSVLNGPENETSYAYMGWLSRTTGDYVHGKRDKAKVGYDAPSATAFRWFYEKVVQDNRTPDEMGVEVWHEGRCGACGRKLTVPESIARGIGPECASRL